MHNFNYLFFLLNFHPVQIQFLRFNFITVYRIIITDVILSTV